jgi:hypothetical protein
MVPGGEEGKYTSLKGSVPSTLDPAWYKPYHKKNESFEDIFTPITDKEASIRAIKHIESMCTKNSNGTYSCEGDVDLSDMNLKVFPVRFKVVKGDFLCDRIQLTSLKGAPEIVGGSFNCGHNQLTSLEGGLKVVGKNFYCGQNHLTNLKGAPREVGGYFDCGGSQLTTLEGAPEEVGGYFYCGGNPLSVKKLKRTVKRDYF